MRPSAFSAPDSSPSHSLSPGKLIPLSFLFANFFSFLVPRLTTSTTDHRSSLYHSLSPTLLRFGCLCYFPTNLKNKKKSAQDSPPLVPIPIP
jgi:hypothetical protein